MALVSTAKAAGAAAAGLLTASWLNKRYAISSDISQIHGNYLAGAFYRQMVHKHRDDDWSFYHVLHMTYGRNDYDQAFVFEDRSWTYGEMRGEIGRLANAFTNLGIRNRTVVAMYVNNSPEFLFAWFALYKIGAIPAPVNTAITKEPFRHCLRICGAEYLLASFELWDKASASLGLDDGGKEEMKKHVPGIRTAMVYDYGTYPVSATTGSLDMIDIVMVHNELPPVTPQCSEFSEQKRPKIGQEDTSCYLFTSGTTGFPKAAIWPAGYSMMTANVKRWPYMYDEQRRMYICLPLFHGTAQYACLPTTLASSGTVILARRFSVTRFWQDCRRSNADSFVYIGEMVRYLVQAPPDPNFPDPKKMHNIKVVYGLGLSAPIWRELRERFGVPWVIEYYSASEAPVSICQSNRNDDDGLGYVARWGPLMWSRLWGQDSLFIIKTDQETGEPVRNKRGLCMRVGFDEKGEAIAKIEPPLRRSHDYVGEGGVGATDKKMLRNVFRPGDQYLRIGDSMSINKKHYIKFHDRLGDTFRAKGHNISTTEVEIAFAKHPDIISANVYAILMTTYGYEGQLGCAAINFRPETPLSRESAIISSLETWLVDDAGLPAYGVPRFLRVIADDGSDDNDDDNVSKNFGAEGGGGGAISDEGRRREDIPGGGERVSVIMKKLKTGLRKEGFQIPVGCRDRMYFIEREGRGFRPLEEGLKQLLLSGKARI